MKFYVGDECTARVRGLGSDGAGVCDAGGFVVFARGVLPGETVELRLTDVRTSYARAEATRIVEASPHRAAPACPHFLTCGGCDLMHMPYAEELEYKRRTVEEAFHRIAGFKDARVEPVAGRQTRLSPDSSLPPAPGPPLRYRNKGQYAYFDGAFGFYASGTHNFTPVGDCLLQNSGNAEILGFIAEWARGAAAQKPRENTRGDSIVSAHNDYPKLKNAVIRRGRNTGDIMIVLNYSASNAGIAAKRLSARAMENFAAEFRSFAQALADRFAGMRSVSALLDGREITAYGDRYIEERLGPYSFRVSRGSFFQVNSCMAEVLCESVLDLARVGPDDVVIDLYCGVGAISAYLASRAKSALGVELSESAVGDARVNADLNGLQNLTILQGDAEKICEGKTAAGEVMKNYMRPGAVALDPPRRGCGARAAEALKSIGAPRVVYVSCDPATLARDSNRLCSGDGAYRIAAIRPIDMFPHTANVETLVLFTK